MAKISPFPGIHYHPKRIGNLADVISPPYDKISTSERAALWNRHEHNVVRLILPPPSDVDVDIMTQSTEAESNDWYHAAAQQFQQWRNNQVLIQDQPGFYVYQQRFTYKGQTYNRTGLFVSLQLDEGSGPLAHEHTFEGPKADRLRLITATQANLSPIFLLADGDPKMWDRLFSNANDSLFQFEDAEGQHHHLSAIRQKEDIEAIQSMMNERILVIADGHHRYETAQNYKQRMMEQTGLSPDDQPWGSVMAMIVPAFSPDLLVLPTHRVLSNLPEEWLNSLKSETERCCDIREVSPCSGPILQSLLNKPEHQQSIAVADAKSCYLVTLKPGAEPEVLQSLPEPLRRLNVSILHHFLFESCLHMTPAMLQPRIRYIRGEKEALDLVQQGQAQAAFLVGALSPKQVFEISQQHVRMPQKSTDFYPKIPTGLLFRPVSNSL